ncbi:endonuclease V [candidate division WOR-3 bacterium]|nr:endonuclease V [candidate division WOR-3 bacterium]
MDWSLSSVSPLRRSFSEASRRKAFKMQEELSQKLILEPVTYNFKSICGTDVAFTTNNSGIAYAVCCLFSFPELKLIEESRATMPINYPYIPGLFAFREGPILLKVIKKLHVEPDIILFDGHGIAHPRGFGLASHLGYLLSKPTIGCAKTRLVGEYKEPGAKQGSSSLLTLNKKIIGAAVRTKDGIKPVFISPGNLIDLETSIKIILSVSQGYRIPEPLRLAHIKSRKIAL